VLGAAGARAVARELQLLLGTPGAGR
jgi:hypothetical protein